MNPCTLESGDDDFRPAAGGSGDQLLAHMIHDLKNPLSAVLWYAELIPDAAPSERREYCQRLHANARALLGLLDGFALLTELRGERPVLSSEPVDWLRLALGVVADIEPVAAFRDQRVICDTAGQGLVSGDRVKLTAAVRNLVLEALRLGPPGVTVTVRARVHQQGGSIQVMVLAGEGNSAAMFDPQRPPLELVRRVARLHGGSLVFDQLPDVAGATLFVGTAMGNK